MHLELALLCFGVVAAMEPRNCTQMLHPHFVHTTPHAKQTSSVAGSVVPQHSCSSGRRLSATRQGRVVLVFLEVEVQLAVDVLVM